MPTETLDAGDSLASDADTGLPPEPGLILVFAGGRAAAVPIALERGEITLGREHEAFATHPDGRVSRLHAHVRFDAGQFLVTDLGSRNGTSADGDGLRPQVSARAARVVRVGDSLLVPVRDVGPYARLGVRVSGGRVEGPLLQEAL